MVSVVLSSQSQLRHQRRTLPATCLATSRLAPRALTSRTLSFVYGPEHQRVKQNINLTSNGTSAYFAGNVWYLNGEDSLGLSYEKEVRANGTTENKHFVSAGGMVFAIFTSRTGTLNGLPATTTSYMNQDQLGSASVITDDNGVVTERLAYDPWGKRRNIMSLPGTPDKLDALVGIKTDRGFTMHEHLDEVGIIHMNGRVYDPLMGRFVSADPHVTNADNLQSYNRYAYVMNNPFLYTDPTGFDWWSDFRDNTLKPVVVVAVAIYAPQLLISSSMGTASVGLAAIGGAAAGFTGTALYGGNIGQSLQGAAQGALNAALFNLAAFAEKYGIPLPGKGGP